MKTWSTFFLLQLYAAVVCAQSTFTVQSSAPVPIVDSVTTSSIAVSAPSCSENFFVMSVNVNIAYPHTGVLAILLNDSVLSAYNGGDGADYTNTTFVSLGTAGAPHIGTGTPPFTGTFASQLDFESLSTFPINGNWTLKVLAPAPLLEGSLESWSVTFGCAAAITDAPVVAASTFSCFPSPADRMLTVTLPDNVGRNATLRLFDARGQLVLEKRHVDASQTTIDLGDMAPGVYSLVSVTEVGHMTVPVYVQR